MAGVRAERGVLGVMLGPSYETPARDRDARADGADAVCMSTAAEASLAGTIALSRSRQSSCITNWAAGRGRRGSATPTSPQRWPARSSRSARCSSGSSWRWRSFASGAPLERAPVRAPRPRTPPSPGRRPCLLRDAPVSLHRQEREAALHQAVRGRARIAKRLGNRRGRSRRGIGSRPSSTLASRFNEFHPRRHLESGGDRDPL